MKFQNTIDSITALDARIHNPARLMIIYLLSKNNALDYLQLMRETGLSSGNITTHLSKLAESGFITINKSFIGRKPNTNISITESGTEAYRMWGKNILHALPEDTLHKLCTHFLSSVMVQKNSAFPVLEWYPSLLSGQPNFLLRDKFRNSVCIPPIEGHLPF
ncbi:MAG: transcriptional regulator [Candidatus Cloacimonas sp.]|jgi:DNA-binding MarR family transcriptional regulator|nr:transcriptional regulator [Candidatus Cloacimonas sp.]